MEDYPRAALKHLEDAQALQASSRFDGAVYLAGYVVECALKTMIEVENKAVPYIHDLNRLQLEVDTLSVLAGSRTGHLFAAVKQAMNQIYAWRPEMRYRAPYVAAPLVQDWLAEARDVYKTAIGGLTLAGLI